MARLETLPLSQLQRRSGPQASSRWRWSETAEGFRCLQFVTFILQDFLDGSLRFLAAVAMVW